MDFKTKLDITADRLAALSFIAKAVHDAKGSSVENKFQFIAQGMATRRKAWDERADKIIAGMAALDPVAEGAFLAHEEKILEAETGFKSMQDAVRDLTGGNGGPPPSGASPPSAPSSPAA